MSSNLRVLTFNIHSGRDFDGSYHLDQTIALIHKINPDICGLQEVDRFWERSNFDDQTEKIARSLKMNSFWAPTLIDGRKEYGIILLSKFPIVSSHKIKLHNPQMVYRPGKLTEDRFLIWSTVRPNKEDCLGFGVTHLGFSEKEQKAQIVEILSAVKDPCILVGDFNMGSGEIPMLKLKEKLKDTNPGGEIVTEPNKEPKKQRDHIFVSQKIQIRDYQVVKSEVSDHYPVWADLEIEKTDF